MSFKSQAQLESDTWFQQRVRACTIQQSETYKDDGRPDIAATAIAILTDANVNIGFTFLRMAAAGPLIADKVDLGDGTIDSTLITDVDILALVQNQFPTIAAMFYDSTGNPK